MDYLDLSLLRVGMLREHLVELLGEPDAVGGSTRKYPEPSIYKYRNIEFHFSPWRCGGLWLVMRCDGPYIHETLFPL